MTERTIFTKSL